MNRWNRRDWLGAAGLATAGAFGTRSVASAAPRGDDGSPGFRYCLNTSTIRGQGLGVEDQVRVAAEAGFDGIEPWVRDLDAFVDGGGSPRSLGARIRDAGLEVPSAIGFFEWGVDEPERRREALEEARRVMGLLAEIGGTRVAAPPTGLTDRSDVHPLRLAERYAALLEVGAEAGVTPQLEVWGFSETLGRLGEAAFVLIECGRDDARLLPDVYHLYKGGSDFEGLRYLDGDAIDVFHLNDYPADPPRAEIGDADRVFPGDGVAPLGTILATLRSVGFRGTLSLELFNRDYWERDALEVAREGLAKMRRVVADSP